MRSSMADGSLEQSDNSTCVECNTIRIIAIVGLHLSMQAVNVDMPAATGAL